MEQKKELWLNMLGLSKEKADKLLPVATNNGYTGFLMSISQKDIIAKLPKNSNALIMVEENFKKETGEYLKETKEKDKIILFAAKKEILSGKEFDGMSKGIYVEVFDRASMNQAIELSNSFPNCIIDFKSDTNIPLELVLAFSQKNHCKVCKCVSYPDDGWIATMTMEMGSYAVLLNTDNIDSIVELRQRFDKYLTKNLDVEALKVVSIKHIGMGDRVCIDTVSKLREDEGMIIGSTSNGGILVSSETHFLPYMELRPFRVNAGAIHSYVFCADNTTKYLSELKAGDELMSVNSKGETKVVSVGRIKMERRPLLLIQAISDKGVNVNTIVQDDWHIRIISENGKVKNSTLLKENDIVMGYTTEPGRHLGVKIAETIVEK
jgi:3-dehydroquinate synthase II/3-amino-4-hydroxybenzoic acid synthase